MNIEENPFQSYSLKILAFEGFFKDCIKHFGSLVEVDHDPYHVSFPAAYSQLSDEEFEEEWLQCLERIKQFQEIPESLQQ